jgi:hypothetical protein
MSARPFGTRSALVVLALLGAELVAPTAAHATTTVFTSTGAEQVFTVPANVRSLHVVAIGAPGGAASGGDSTQGAGGLGARAVAEIAVHPGEKLYVEVGGAGQASPLGQAGFNGGGAGGGLSDTDPGSDGGGGGSSDIRTIAASAGVASLASRKVIAGGGGGATSGPVARNGGGGGLPGDPNCSGCAGGSGASRTQGGTGGTSTGGAGGTGGLGFGGPGGVGGGEGQGGGGGGGGLYGGGGGGGAADMEDTAGGGGGGSSGFGSGVTGASVHADNSGVPSVTLTYTKSTTTSVTVKRHRRSLSVSGTVKPAVPGVRVAVTLLRKHGHRYKKVATKRPVMTTTGRFTTSFTRAKPGKCELTAVFAGNRTFAASRQTKRLAC